MNRKVILITIIGLILSCAGVERSTKETTVCEYTHNQKMWALAAIGIITEMNDDRHDLLGGCEKTEENKIRVIEKLLKEWWGIEKRETLIETLNWLDESGHRKRMYNEGKALNELSQNEVIDVLNKYKSDKQIHQRLYEAYWGFKAYGEKSVIAWDYCRYIALCGWGFVAGYLSEKEAWEFIMPKAIELQNSFTSWGGMADNYLHGRAYWSWKQTVGSNMPGHKAWRALGWDKPDSPWRKYNWNMNLSCSNANSLPPSHGGPRAAEVY